MWKSGKLETEGGVGHRGHGGGRRTLSIDHLAFFAAKKAVITQIVTDGISVIRAPPWNLWFSVHAG